MLQLLGYDQPIINLYVYQNWFFKIDNSHFSPGGHFHQSFLKYVLMQVLNIASHDFHKNVVIRVSDNIFKIN